MLQDFRWQLHRWWNSQFREGEEMLRHCGLGKKWVSGRLVVASLMQHNYGTRLTVRGEEMLHHCGLGKEWVSEREMVASLMQHNNGTRPTFGRGRNVASLWVRKEWVSERLVVASLMQHIMERVSLSGGRDVASLWVRKEWVSDWWLHLWCNISQNEGHCRGGREMLHHWG